MTAVAERPPDAADVLVRSTWRLLRLLARRAARRLEMDEDDVFQVMVARVARKAPRWFDPARGKMTTFAGFVARDAVWDLRRKRKRRRAALAGRTVGTLRHDVMGREPDPADVAERADELDRLRAGVASLAPADRRVITERFGLAGGRPASLEAVGGGSGKRGTEWACEAFERLQGAML